MAKEYLDKNGLTYLWGKLKGYFQEKLVSGTNIKTINGQSILGSGNVVIGGTQDSRLVTNNTTELEAGYSTDYSTYNINMVNTDGDAISINNLGNANMNPKITLLPDNDWSQKVEVGDLAFTSDIPALPTLQSATVSSAYSGACSYLKFGRMVIFDANITTTGALTNGTVLASGLPANHVTATMAYGFNNNSSTENVGVYITSSGTLTVRGTFASANRTIRVSGAYISAS